MGSNLLGGGAEGGGVYVRRWGFQLYPRGGGESGGERVCVLGGAEQREFIDFVERSGLINVNMQGRKFTCYSSRGPCKSRIDRELINE